MGPARAVAFALLLAACSDGATTLLLQIDGPASLTSLDVSVAVGASTVSRTIAASKLPGSLIVVLPDQRVDVTLDLVAHGPSGEARAHTVVTAIPHQQVRVPIVLSLESADLGLPDLAAADQAVADLAVADLATPDLSTADLRTGPPVARLISTSYYSDYSGNTFRFPSSMTKTGYAVNTAGVVDGDLLLLIANIDNGSSMLFPDPIAPGFHQLAQAYFGSDGQTYVVSWKLASGEPATYTGTYGTGLGSGSSVLSLIAVSGANQTTPINAFSAGNDTPAASPTPVTSAGVTTTVPGCVLVFAAGSDWLGTPGSNTFTLPAGYTQLTAVGDRGDNHWDWTSQMVGWTTQPAAGATGTVMGTLTSTTAGIGWTALIAVAPP